MKKHFLLIALVAGLAACSSETVTDAVDDATEQTDGGAEKLKEMERLSAERDALYDKHIGALEEGDMAASTTYKAQMDSVDALYQALLKQ